MATLQELRGLFNDSDLLEKIEAALIISANNLLSGTPTAAQTSWAAHVFTSPKAEAKKAVMAVLASNSAATTGQILGAADAAIQTNVDSVSSTLVAALVGV